MTSDIRHELERQLSRLTTIAAIRVGTGRNYTRCWAPASNCMKTQTSLTVVGVRAIILRNH